MQQDDAQALCSRYRNQPPPTVAEQIVAAQRQSMRYPADGKLMGDWKKGEALARIGSGGHIGKIQPDPPSARRGGNCYACHRLAADEVAAGTIGPGLTGYGKQRGDVARIDPVCVREDLQRAGLLPVLVDAALRPQQLAHARGDRRRRGVSARSGVAGEQDEPLCPPRVPPPPRDRRRRRPRARSTCRAGRRRAMRAVRPAAVSATSACCTSPTVTRSSCRCTSASRA